MKTRLLDFRKIMWLGAALALVGGCDSRKPEAGAPPTASSNSVFVHKSSVGVVSKTWPKIEAGRYYQQREDILTLGDWDGKAFVPLDPPEIIDVSKSFPVSLHYPILPSPSKEPVKTYLKDDAGRWYERSYDPATGALQEVEIRPR